MLYAKALQLFGRLALFGAMGCVTAVAVAWGLAAWLPQTGWKAYYETGERGIESPRKSRLIEFRTVGAIRRQWWTDRQGPYVVAPYLVIKSRATPIDQTGLAPQGISWGFDRNALNDPRRMPDPGGEHATGLPLPALSYEFAVRFRQDGSVDADVRGGICLDSKPQKPWSIRALPVTPIWTGILINSCIYALAGWGVVAALRRVLLLCGSASNKCPHCKYSRAGLLRGSVCPECGRSVEF